MELTFLLKSKSLITALFGLCEAPNDIMRKNEVIKTVNGIFKSSDNEEYIDFKLRDIIINNIDDSRINAVNIIPHYTTDFDRILFKSREYEESSIFHYSIEIRYDALKNMSPETLAAIISYYVLQMISGCFIIRFRSAYANAIDDVGINDTMLSIYSSVIRSEVMYLMFTDICMRPFESLIAGYDYLGFEDVMVELGLAEAFDSYVRKKYSLDSCPMSPNNNIAEETKNDIKCVRRFLISCKDGTIRQVYCELKQYCPILAIKMQDRLRIGIDSREDKLVFGLCDIPNNSINGMSTANPLFESSILLESMLTPDDQIELRFQLDKILVSAKYIDTEAQRAATLYEIKCLELKISKKLKDIMKRLKKHPDDVSLNKNKEVLLGYYNELENTRNEIVKTPQRQVHYGVFVKYPAGYDF